MAKRFKLGTDRLVVWNDHTTLDPFNDPEANADRVLFSTTFNYSRIIDKRTVNCTFPTANGGGERSGIIPLFAHGRGGQPRVRGNFILNGKPLSLGCHVPVQFYTNTNGTAVPSLVRLAILGATNTDVVVSWYAGLNGLYSGSYLAEFTVPMTIEVFEEMN